MMISQHLTPGGSLYGYTDTEMAPHMFDRHGGGWEGVTALEEQHLNLHADGADHIHIRTETGALSIDATEGNS